MNRPFAIVLLAGALFGCEENEAPPEDPPYAVPGVEVVQPPSGQPMLAAMPTEAPSFDPPLAVPGQPSPIPPPPMPAAAQAAAAQAQAAAAQARAQAAQAGAQQAPPLTLAPGFVPDPAVARGAALGQVSASSLDPECAGFVPAQPAHVVQLTAAFDALRVLVSSPADTVLVIRQPDGTFRCNDDAEPGVNVNPLIEGAFTPGAYTVWVGTLEQGTTPAPYVLGFTELSSVTHAALGG